MSSSVKSTQRTAWLVALGVYIVLALLVRLVGFLPPPGGPSLLAWPVWETSLVLLGIPLVPAAIVGLWGYAFAKNLGVVPRTVWIVAFACYAGLAILIHFVTPLNTQPGDIGTWPIAGQVAFTFLMPSVFLILVPLYGYIYRDAKRRGMRYVMWVLLAIFVPDLIGVILYFILRDPLPAECPVCHTVNLAKFAFCPHCGATMRPVCPQCGRALDQAWSNCGYCGTKLPANR